MTNRKRGQGEGSVYRRKDGRWAGSVSLGGGRRKNVYGRTAAEVRAKLDEVQRAIADGRPASNTRRTVGHLFDEWLTAKRDTVRPKTLDSYAGLIRRHARPALGSIPLSDLRVTHLEHFYRDRSAKVSPKTVRNLAFVVRAALAWAERRDWIARNPANLIAREDLPRLQHREIQVLSGDEARSLMDAARGTKSEALIAVALVTAARVGELMALSWDQVDLDAARLRITRSLQYLDGEPTLVEPKTHAGVRELALPPNAVTALRAHRVAQNETALGLGKAWRNRMNLVFTSQTGAPLNRHAVLRQYLRPLLKVAGLPETMNFHLLRHTGASLMLARHVPVPVVQEMLGHANPAITMSIYSHALPNSQGLVAETMNEVFGGD